MLFSATLESLYSRTVVNKRKCALFWNYDIRGHIFHDLSQQKVLIFYSGLTGYIRPELALESDPRCTILPSCTYFSEEF